MQGKSNCQLCHSTEGRTVRIVLKIKWEEEGRREKGNLLINHQASMALPLSLPYTPLKRRKKRRKVCLNVPSSKGTPTQD